MSVEPTSDPTSNSALSRETILRAFEALSLELGQRGVVGEVCLLGGTVKVLAFTARLTTKDVGALFQPAQPIRQSARRIAAEQNLPDDWLNDGAKGFLSARNETTTGNLPCPTWTAGDARVLHRPWFASPLAALRAVLLLESPPGFRGPNRIIHALTV